MENTPQNMGIGELGAATTVFVRKFRWTFKAEKLPEYWSVKIAFDKSKNLINLELYEVMTPPENKVVALEWPDFIRANPGKYKGTFTTYDGCGKELYTEYFYNLRLLEQKSDFDYAVSDESRQRLVLKYDSVERTYLPQVIKIKNEIPEAFKEALQLARKTKPVTHKHTWKIKIQDANSTSKEFEVKIKSRPNLRIEETSINYLNAKTWLPGRSKWELFEFDIPQESFEQIRQQLECSRYSPRLCLGLFREDHRLELWMLNNVWIEKHHPHVLIPKTTSVALRFDSAEYIPEQTAATAHADDIERRLQAETFWKD